MKDNQKHLTLSDRITIEQSLNEGKTFSAIAILLGKDPTTISKEVRKHRSIKQHKDKSKLPRCSHDKTCEIKHLCNNSPCQRLCRDCKTCRNLCKRYKPKECGRLRKAPYVCNSCASLSSCPYFRWTYVAKYANDCYRDLLSSSREGINQTAEDMQRLDLLVSPLILRGQSIAHIYSNHTIELKALDCSRRTLYKYIDKSYFTARNIDLPRKVKYKKRKASTTAKPLNRSYRQGRTYEEFKTLIDADPNQQVVELDTVEGQKGGKVLLTLLFRNCSLMLAFIMDEKSQACVQAVFNELFHAVGFDVFRKLFPIILTDNGCEFQDPMALEYTQDGQQRTRIYYCNPNCSWQKGMIEKNHEFIRYIVPKGNSFDAYSQREILLMINHINSTARDNLNGCTPFQLSKLLLDNSLHNKLSLEKIEPDDVMLKPALLKH